MLFYLNNIDIMQIDAAKDAAVAAAGDRVRC